MDSNKLRNLFTEKNWFFCLASLVWLYVLIRAFTVPHFHDEVGTFYYYVQSGDYIPFTAHWDANNHFLNSFLGNIAYQIFGDQMWAMRMPSVLISIFYFIGIYKIGSLLKDKSLRWTWFIVMLTAQYLLEHLAYLRGYGLSMSFLIMAVYYLMMCFKVNQIKYYWLTCTFLLLAVSANLTLMNTVFIGVMLMSFNILIQWNKNKLLNNVYSFLSFAVILPPIYYFIQFVFALKDKGALYMGSKDGYWSVSIYTNIEAYMGQYNHIFAGIVIVIFALICILAIVTLFKKISIKSLVKFQYIPVYLLVGNVLATLIQAYKMDVNFPEDRAAMYLFVFLIAGLVFQLDLFQKPKLNIAGIALMVVFPLTGLSMFNFSYHTYLRDHMSVEFYDIVLKDAKENKYRPSVAGIIRRHFNWEYLNKQNGDALNNIQIEDYPNQIADYQIIENKNVWMFHKNYETIAQAPDLRLNLLKRKKQLEVKSFSIAQIEENLNFKDEFTDLYSLIVDSNNISGLGMDFEVEIELSSDQIPFNAWIVIKAEDYTPEQISYETIPLNRIAPKWNNRTITKRILLSVDPKKVMKYTVYLWNIDKVNYSIHNGVVKVGTLHQ